MAIYKIIQEIMDEKNLSVADTARICKLPDSTVRGIIRRKQETVALEVAFKLSEGLNVSLEKLNGLPERVTRPDIEEQPTIVTDDGLLERERLFRSLSPEAQELVLQNMKLLAEREAKDK